MKISKKTKIIAGVVAVVAIAVVLYNKNKDKKMVSSVTPSSPMKDSSAANFIGDSFKWCVGEYYAATNQTYIFPEGNYAGGHRVNGRLNVARGGYFYKN